MPRDVHLKKKKTPCSLFSDGNKQTASAASLNDQRICPTHDETSEVETLVGQIAEGMELKGVEEKLAELLQKTS